jgi:pyruvate dehydrogenase E1 component
MPDGAADGIRRGLYKVRPALRDGEPGAPVSRGDRRTAVDPRAKVHLFGSGAILRETLRAQEILAERFNVAADVWSVTSYLQLRRDALEVERWNLLHPTEPPRRSYLEQTLAGEQGVFVAASDYLKSVPEMITRWVPGGLYPLGTDGFGRSETRPVLRRFFEVDAECIALAALSQLARRGLLEPTRVEQAIQQLKIDPDKADPMRS